MNASELWKQNLDLAQKCLEHPFVQGIASGELPRERFAGYIAQDAYFLEAFIRAYALALAKSPEREGMDAFRELITGALDELKMHGDYARQWGINLQPEPEVATLAYTDFLLRIASMEPVGSIIAGMTPCMRLYAWLGQELKPKANPDSVYHEWIETYSSEGFEALAVRLEQLLDRYSGDRVQVTTNYRRAMQLEFNFFDSAWV